MKDYVLSNKEIFKGFLKNNKLNLFLTVLFSTAISVIQVLISIIMMNVVDKTVEGNFDDIFNIALQSVVIVLIYVVAYNMWAKFKNKFIYKAMLRYKNEFYHKILQQKIWLYDENNTSSTMSALTNDVIKIETNYLENIHQVIRQGILFVLGIVAMIYLNYIMFGVIIIISSLPVLITFVTGRFIKRGMISVSNENKNFVDVIKDLLTGFSVIKACKAEKDVSSKFEDKNASLEKSREKYNNVIALVESLSTVSGVVVLIFVFIVGAILCMKGIISVGVIIAYVQLLNYIISPLQTIPLMLNEIRATSTLINNNYKLLSCNEQENLLEKKNLEKEISLKNVSCKYNDFSTALKNINFVFEKNKSYAIVGKSGSGKSTLLKLLLGYFEEYEGSVSIDGVQIKNIQQESLYSIFSVIQQNVFIFNTSIKENIAMFKEIDVQRYEEAINVSELNHLISEKGSSYICGENGNKLSGGERQRISIARSVVKGLDVLLMDEATSSLDIETAKLFEKTVSDLDGITKIAVTHRLDEQILKYYDTIIVMDNGEIVESGTLEFLKKSNGHFSSLLKQVE